MNGPRIGGIEPAEPTPETPSVRTESASQETPHSHSSQEDRKAVHRPNWFSMLTAGVAVAVAVGAGIYAHRLNGHVTMLQTQLKQTRATAQTALDKVSVLKIPKDLSTEVASIEITANKLRAADEALRRSFDEQSQKFSALEKHLSEATTALAARLTDTEREMMALQSKNEARLTNIIAVLKNQDKILRRLAETPSTSRSEE